MPTYVYYCSSCQKTHEIKQKITDEPLKECPDCKKMTLQRTLPKDVNFQFKGSGFYITDYGKELSSSKDSSSSDSSPKDPPKDPPKGCGTSCACC